MNTVKKLFRQKNIYDLADSDGLFIQSMRDNAIAQYEKCGDYKRILDEAGFDPHFIKSMDDLVNLPFLPTLYFKHHKLFSMPERKMLIKVTSSGTSGKKSLIGFDAHSLLRGLDMVNRVGKYHRLWSLRPVRYVVFGYEPSRENKTGVSKTAFGFTLFAPALSRTYALKITKNGYQLDFEHIKKTLEKCVKSKTPLRTIGFPAYTFFLLKEMCDNGIRLQMPEGSLIALSGGWKQFYAQKVEKDDFYTLVMDVLGIDDKHIIEFFGAVEHPILYTDCRCHHFHVPVYSRVIIRDPDSFNPVPDGHIGLINFLTPMVKSAPLLSVMTDDLGILHSEKCPCGESSPWLEIIGRVGIKDIITCAAGAEDFLKEQKKI